MKASKAKCFRIRDDRYHIPDGILTPRDLEDPGPFEPMWSQSIETGETLVDKRAEVLPHLAPRERRVVEMPASLNEARKRVTKEALEEFERQGMSIQSVAVELGVAPWQVSRLRKEYGLAKDQAAPGSLRAQPKKGEPRRQEAAAPATSAPEHRATEERVPEPSVQPTFAVTGHGRYSGKDLYRLLGGLCVMAEFQECEFEVEIEIRRCS